MGLFVKQFDLTMFTVRAPGDSTALSQGEYVDDFKRFQFLVKYKSELVSAVKYCNIPNIQEYIANLNL